MRITNLRVEHYLDSAVINETKPRISWSFEGLDQQWRQKAHEISLQRGGQDGCEVFQVVSSQSLYVPWPSRPLNSCEIATLKVRVQSEEDSAWTSWSDPLQIEVALLNTEDWRCSLIQPLSQRELSEPVRPVRFRRSFDLKQAPHSARLYITAHGIYESFINGTKAGDDVLAPGWTSYDHELPYQTLDVLSQLTSGTNVIAAEVAEGWYAGRLGFAGGERNIWGSSIGLLAQLIITYGDGSTETIGTDGDWTWAHGPLLQAEIYNGETFDSRVDSPGWDKPLFDDKDWQAVTLGQLDFSTLKAPDSPPVRRMEVVPAQTKLQSPKGDVILDFGQNLVGWVRCELSGPSGHTVRLVHAEVLQEGECATEPLREAKCTDTVILSGEPLVYEPRFTFHGFRYVQITGYTLDEVDLDKFRAVVIHSSMPRTGWFECSDPMLNKLHENVVWSMKGNFVSVPTDCPQRDERLGWTGDVQAFASTAAYLYDTGGMLKSWLRSLASEQTEDGGAVPPLFSPNVWKGRPNTPAAIWSDALISVPWDLYQASGDTAMLADLYINMETWLKNGVLRDKEGLLWDPNHPQLGDWLEPSAPPNDPSNGATDGILVSNAFLIGMTDIMARISKILRHDEQCAQWEDQATRLRAQFARAYITDQGRVVSDTQTALALCIYFSLFPTAHQQEVAAARLVYLIKRKARFIIATGFAGTPILGHALNKIGQHQLFYRMLVHRKPLSWLYPVTMGATTIWERWDSMLPDGTLNSSNMTSFNHYALGSVANWMHSTIAGIKPLEPGWGKIRIAPVPGATLSSCRARYLSPYGEIDVRWELKDDQLHLEARIPGNTEAEITLPGGETKVVGSGNHVLTSVYDRPVWPPLPVYAPFVLHDDDEP